MNAFSSLLLLHISFRCSLFITFILHSLGFVPTQKVVLFCFPFFSAFIHCVCALCIGICVYVYVCAYVVSVSILFYSAARNPLSVFFLCLNFLWIAFMPRFGIQALNNKLFFLHSRFSLSFSTEVAFLLILPDSSSFFICNGFFTCISAQRFIYTSYNGDNYFF